MGFIVAKKTNDLSECLNTCLHSVGFTPLTRPITPWAWWAWYRGWPLAPWTKRCRC